MLIQSLETAKNTLLNTQIQIQITNHNISRADDKNYHRQEVILETRPPLRYGRLYIGIGARIQQIRQAIDPLVEKRLLNAVSREHEYMARSVYMEVLNSYTIDDGDSGLSAYLQNFWNSWDVYNENPGQPEKEGVIKAAENLAAYVSELHSHLKDLQSDIDKDLEASIDRVNELLELIKDYNNQIMKAELPNSGIKANDLRDIRYAAIKELSEFLPISVSEDDMGRVEITVNDGSTSIELVRVNPDGSSSAGKLNFIGNGNFDYDDAGGTHISVDPHDLNGGKLFGLYEVYSTVGEVIDRIEKFADNLANEVNSRHGSNVFIYNASADDILTVASGFNPDHTRALDVSNLQDAPISSLNNLTFSQYLADTQYFIGQEHKNAIDKRNLYENIRLELEKQQQALSGVSLDEELVNVIKFQHVFQAASRIIRATSEMLDTVVGMV